MLLILVAVAASLPAQILERIDKLAPHYKQVSRQIWETPELSFHEFKSSGLLKEELRQAGFRITENVGGMPTAFVAEWGKGEPVVGILGEFDALAGLSQADEPERRALVAGAPGHGCGHNLLGTAAALAAVAVKQELEATGRAGTIRFYGTPAEEGGAGKVYMIRAGAFKDVGAVLAWHPADTNQADDNSWLSNLSARFRYHGKASHAAGAPEAGRSALDALELTTHAINMLREHVPQETRMHYIITKGGAATNIVPDYAELSLVVRHPDLKTLEGIWARVQKCAQAGALATETTVDIEITGAYANMQRNSVLRDLLDRNVHRVGGFTYSADEAAFAEKIRATLNSTSLAPLSLTSEVLAPKSTQTYVSTDVGDVSWVVPTGQLLAAALPAGVPLHTWQSTACTGTEIGRKGMLVAAKTLALSAAELFEKPQLVKDAKAAWDKAMAGQTYRSLIPAGHQPPLNDAH
jgi:aminobenzoyl-glutamate utilization protein B